MNIGKVQYDNIPIPAQLDQVILEAIDKAARENRLIRLRRWAVSVAAVFCILFLSANITPIYAYASQIPVIGSVVRVLHIGTGGERTDGAYADAQTEGETVQLLCFGVKGLMDTNKRLKDAILFNIPSL